jgi:hypothetical protein
VHKLAAALPREENMKKEPKSLTTADTVRKNEVASENSKPPDDPLSVTAKIKALQLEDPAASQDDDPSGYDPYDHTTTK